MATVYSNDNFSAYNRKQLRTIAPNLGIYHDVSDTIATFTTKIKAK